MATASPTRSETALTSEAFELIGDFYKGVRHIVRTFAEETARKRLNLPDGTPVLIEVDDVQEAGAKVIAALRGLVSNGEIQEELQELTDSLNPSRN